MKYKSQGESAAERCKFSFQFKFLFAALLKVVAAKLKKKWKLTFFVGLLKLVKKIYGSHRALLQREFVLDRDGVLIRTQRGKRLMENDACKTMSKHNKH